MFIGSTISIKLIYTIGNKTWARTSHLLNKYFVSGYRQWRLMLEIIHSIQYFQF